ncbi:aldo/keto reductase [Pontibacter sp. E15-1]|uniref:aldo/keto reductase n=1 Tax=Pontibacter sp. E15-1 TaxID=2919918 RepID=UPI001F4F71C0|nr:aldo/keto reductase [Pontibacter sp. E15-1]MCJ8166374.1 aldo/keto reductase [Pontibacter sp. E15-1]
MKQFNDYTINRLILGTAQFGLDYGISNREGKILQQEANAILELAGSAGITTLDTAAAYGDSEKTIGNALHENGQDFEIITKYLSLDSYMPVAEALEESLKRLQVTTVSTYMLHNYSIYKKKPEILLEFEQLKKEGKIGKIGISLYHPSEAIEIIDNKAKVDIIQFPYSVFDRRFESVLPLLRQNGIMTHVRSVYLQGLYFMPPEKLPGAFSSIAPKIKKLHQLSRQYQLPLGALLLWFVLSNPNVSQAVIGVESLKTLQENIDFSKKELSHQAYRELQNFRVDDEKIILPYNWPAK